MLPVRRTAAATALFLATAVPLTAAEFDPYKVPREVVAGRIDAVALWPVLLPPGTEDSAALEARLEKMLVAALESKGYRAIASAEYLAAWLEPAAKVGGVFDPVTGQPDEEKFTTVRDFARREVAARHGVDAILIAHVTADVVHPWVKPRFMHPGEFHAFDQMLVWQGRPLQAHRDNQPQSVSGTFLNVVLEDLKGARMYAIRAPIEYTRIYLLGSYEDVPSSVLYKDQARLQSAVDTALGPLVARQP
jgi:hypothetical protein